jgi:hypothetical protein
LDRIFASVEWGEKYPLSKVTMLPKGCNDHNPLRIEFGGKPKFKEHLFRFEKWWLQIEEFAVVIQKAWSLECQSQDPIDVWQIRIRNLRKKIKGWSRNRETELKNPKISL